ncbi:MAG: Gfo/Idh/MocA family oxidoreductase [Limnochordia bacterium]|nr:Gfo/Idh/MocA family oxidoreductase [Limnochordia bacterium]
MDKIKIGVVGVSGRGAMARCWHNERQERSVVVAGMDTSTEFLEGFKQRVNPNAYTTTNFEELLEQDIDAVAIFSPDHFHEEQTIAALKAGKHVFCEKPMAISVEGCDRMLEAWKKSGKHLMIGHNMRYMRFVRTMKEIIDSGVIGELKMVWCRHFINYGGRYYFHDWHGNSENTDTLLLQKGAHDIDVIHWLAGGYTTSVVGTGGLDYYGGEKDNDLRCPTCPERKTCVEVQSEHEPARRQMCVYRKEIDVEDTNMILMNLDNGVRAAYLQCHFTPDVYRNYTFIGTEGRLENVNGEDTIMVLTRRSNTWREYSSRTYNVKSAAGGHGGSDELITEDFLDLLLTGKSAISDPVAARMAVATGSAGARSIRNNSKQVLVNKPSL